MALQQLRMWAAGLRCAEMADCRVAMTAIALALVAGFGDSAAAAIEVPPQLEFPTTFRSPGSAAPSLPVTASNTGAATVRVRAVVVGSADIWQSLEAGVFTLAPQASHDFPVRFTPPEAGGFDARLELVDDDGGVVLATVQLSGRARNRPVDLQAVEIDLGVVGVGVRTIRPGALALANRELAETFVLRAIETNDAAFEILGATEIELEPRVSHAFDVIVTPATAGDFEATAEVFLDEDPTPQAIATLRGRAVSSGGGGGCASSGAGDASTCLLVLLVLGRVRSIRATRSRSRASRRP